MFSFLLAAVFPFCSFSFLPDFLFYPNTSCFCQDTSAFLPHHATRSETKDRVTQLQGWERIEECSFGALSVKQVGRQELGWLGLYYALSPMLDPSSRGAKAIDNWNLPTLLRLAWRSLSYAWTHIYTFVMENQSTKMINNSFVVLEIVQELNAALCVKVLFLLPPKTDEERAGFYCHPVEIHLSLLSQQLNTIAARSILRQERGTNLVRVPWNLLCH